MEKFERSEKELTYDDFLNDLAEHKKKLLKELILILITRKTLKLKREREKLERLSLTYS